MNQQQLPSSGANNNASTPTANSSTSAADLPLRNVYIASLPDNFNEQKLRAMFECYGAIESIKVAHDASNGVCKGYAFVLFRETRDAERAIVAMIGREVEGQRIQVRFAHNPVNAKKSHRGLSAPSGGVAPPPATAVTVSTPALAPNTVVQAVSPTNAGPVSHLPPAFVQLQQPRIMIPANAAYAVPQSSYIQQQPTVSQQIYSINSATLGRTTPPPAGMFAPGQVLMVIPPTSSDQQLQPVMMAPKGALNVGSQQGQPTLVFVNAGGTMGLNTPQPSSSIMSNPAYIS